jgi:hypothetical protein
MENNTCPTTSDNNSQVLTIGSIKQLGCIPLSPENQSDNYELIPLREFQRNIAKYLKKGGSYLLIGREGHIKVTIGGE